jgi:hypothetical protein
VSREWQGRERVKCDKRFALFGFLKSGNHFSTFHGTQSGKNRKLFPLFVVVRDQPDETPF